MMMRQIDDRRTGSHPAGPAGMSRRFVAPAATDREPGRPSHWPQRHPDTPVCAPMLQRGADGTRGTAS